MVFLRAQYWVHDGFVVVVVVVVVPVYLWIICLSLGNYNAWWDRQSGIFKYIRYLYIYMHTHTNILYVSLCMQFIEMLSLLLLKRKQLKKVFIVINWVLERIKHAFNLARHAEISHLLISSLTVVSVLTGARGEERSSSSLVVSFKIEFKILLDLIYPASSGCTQILFSWPKAIVVLGLQLWKGFCAVKFIIIMLHLLWFWLQRFANFCCIFLTY